MIRVSAIIPVYNGAATVGRAIQSVIDQQFDGFEVIVVDDGSTDSTAEVLKGWGTRIKIVRQPNGGPSVARNTGARLAGGEYLAFLDADDEWLPGKLDKTVGALDSEPDAVLAYSNFRPVDHSGCELEETFVEDNSAHAPSMEDLLTRWWPILTSTVVMRRLTFERCGGFNEEFKTAGYEDPFFWLLAREQGEFVYIPEPLALYRTEPELERLARYASGCGAFIRLVRRRYGAAGAALANEVVKAQVSWLGHKGLIAMRQGDRAEARRAFMLALRYKPLHFRMAARLLRTFLPAAVARSLSGRTREQPRCVR